MNAINKPIEMISVCDPRGEIAPARFRLPAEDQSLTVVRIRRVEAVHKIDYVGIEMLQYICAALIGGRERRFELRYSVRAHRWVLHAFLDGGDV